MKQSSARSNINAFGAHDELVLVAPHTQTIAERSVPACLANRSGSHQLSASAGTFSEPCYITVSVMIVSAYGWRMHSQA